MITTRIKTQAVQLSAHLKCYVKFRDKNHRQLIKLFILTARILSDVYC